MQVALCQIIWIKPREHARVGLVHGIFFLCLYKLKGVAFLNNAIYVISTSNMSVSQFFHVSFQVFFVKTTSPYDHHYFKVDKSNPLNVFVMTFFKLFLLRKILSSQEGPHNPHPSMKRSNHWAIRTSSDGWIVFQVCSMQDIFHC